MRVNINKRNLSHFINNILVYYRFMAFVKEIYRTYMNRDNHQYFEGKLTTISNQIRKFNHRNQKESTTSIIFIRFEHFPPNQCDETHKLIKKHKNQLY